MRINRALIAAVVAAVPLVVGVLGVATAPAAGQERPVVDTTYLYGQLYDISTNYVYRISGADGPPQDPSSPFNIPPTINGWQEFYAHWKNELTSTGAMGSLGASVTAKDHFFRRSGISGYSRGTVTMTIASPAVFTLTTHGMVAGQPVYFRTTGSLPTGIVADTPYYVSATGLATSTFQVSATPGGPSVNTSGTQSGTHTLFFYTPYQFDSNDAEVTIPGSSCAGQRVLLTAHPDEVPVPTTAAALIPTNSTANFGVARRQITLSNLGNGGAYDDASGLAMTMAEFQALLRWYEANNTWPKRTLKVTLLDARQRLPLSPGNEGANYYVNTLIPKGPQGKVVLYVNMDMNGLEYPARHWGTEFFLKSSTNGGVGPWFTNIAATPLAANTIYPSASAGWAKIQANLPAVQSFRTALQTSIADGFAAQGAKYNFSVPLENPLRYNRFGGSPAAVPAPQSKPAYSTADQTAFSPIRDDAIGRFDQVAFNNQGIPGFNVFGSYDSTADDNPYPNNGNSPQILQYSGYDTTFQIGNGTPTATGEGTPLGYTGDTLDHLNYWASGLVHGLGGVEDPSIELVRALELPATWTSYLLQRDEYAGAVAKGSDPIAYFETSPVNPTAGQLSIDFDASFSRTGDGSTAGLTYFWDFGDGTTATGGPTISHTYAGPIYADVKVAVFDGSHGTAYRQAIAVGGTSAPAPATDPCGMLTPTEQGSLFAAAGH